MSHTPPPDDPTAILKALLRKLEKHIDASLEISDPDAHKALQKGLSIITGTPSELGEPGMCIIEGGLSKRGDDECEGVESAPPKLSVHSKIAPSNEGNPSKKESLKSTLDYEEGAQFSVHFLSSQDELPFLTGQSLEQGKISLSGKDSTQTILFGKSERHVRVYCQEGEFSVGSADGMVATITEGQSIDIESNCVYVSADAPAIGQYAMIDGLGLEW